MTEDKRRWIDETNSLVQKMTLASNSFRASVIVDISIAHDLGVSPQEAANAVMGYNRKLLRVIIMRMPEYDPTKYQLDKEQTNESSIPVTRTELEGVHSMQVLGDKVPDSTRSGEDAC